jgi:hypothetical protein
MALQEILSIGTIALAAAWIGWRTFKSWTRPTDCGCNGCDVKKQLMTAKARK